MPVDPHKAFQNEISRSIPSSRVITDELRALAYGTDASFYRLIPKVVVIAESEEEITTILRAARQCNVAVTFRAAGTSLSGQSITDSVLVMLGFSWRGHRVLDAGRQIALQPGIVGAHANRILLPYGRKIGPDPASINVAMVGGIAANNASGMCCGTAQNSYKTLASMRILFADGTQLDTADESSRKSFAESHPELVRAISSLGARVRSNQTLANRIRQKYTMKNTTGYSLNALVDFEDPIEIIQHLMIGSEGTLGFIAEITYNTVPDFPHRASALILLPDIATACRAVVILKKAPVQAVELMDRASLRSVEEKAGIPSYLRELAEPVAALLVETAADSREALLHQIDAIQNSLDKIEKVRPLEFTSIAAEYATLWNIRKGLFPSIGAMRKTGTTVIIEDVAFPIPRLAEATLNLQALFVKHGYSEAIIFGHALEGNLHFVFTQDFNQIKEVERYRGFLEDVTRMVVHKFDGSLKAEHGTGRNMAPFVELEWGAEAFGLMREIKTIFDPLGLLNPGVILNGDPEAHIKALKPLPAADPIVDKCIECGFCEVHCPSKDLTLTPRQRIVVYREMERLRTTGTDLRRLESLRELFDYQGNQTCATDGLCATSCPVGIDTGKLVKELRSRQISPGADAIASFIAGHMPLITASLRGGLRLVNVLHGLLGTRFMSASAHLLRRVSGNRLPLWNPWMPGGATRVPRTANGSGPAVVYFPTCINRSMGPARVPANEPSLTTLIMTILGKAGYRVIIPKSVDKLCCGMAFASKGFNVQGDRKAGELQEALVRASENGNFPILVDMSPCLYRMKEVFSADLKLFEPVQFVLTHLRDRLEFTRTAETVTVHTTCSAEKMGLANALKEVAAACAENVIVPPSVECCGWAGDRGFTYPELNASALSSLRSELPPECKEGFSTSRTCEIGLSMHSGIPYRSILVLVDRCTTPLGTKAGR